MRMSPFAESFRYAVKVTAGTNVALQCHFPASGQVKANALWFKDTGAGKRTELNIQDDLTYDKKLELLYPNDQDQTIVLRRAAMDDAGVYYCETAEGESLSTVDLTVEGKLY